MKFYHAAPRETMEKIVGEGRIRKSWDGEVCVIEVDIDKNRVRESHDHSEAFFQCKAYIHVGDIELKGNENVWNFEFDI